MWVWGSRGKKAGRGGTVGHLTTAAAVAAHSSSSEKHTKQTKTQTARSEWVKEGRKENQGGVSQFTEQNQAFLSYDLRVYKGGGGEDAKCFCQWCWGGGRRGLQTSFIKIWTFEQCRGLYHYLCLHIQKVALPLVGKEKGNKTGGKKNIFHSDPWLHRGCYGDGAARWKPAP